MAFSALVTVILSLCCSAGAGLALSIQAEPGSPCEAPFIPEPNGDAACSGKKGKKLTDCLAEQKRKRQQVTDPNGECRFQQFCCKRKDCYLNNGKCVPLLSDNLPKQESFACEQGTRSCKNWLYMKAKARIVKRLVITTWDEVGGEHDYAMQTWNYWFSKFGARYGKAEWILQDGWPDLEALFPTVELRTTEKADESKVWHRRAVLYILQLLEERLDEYIGEGKIIERLLVEDHFGLFEQGLAQEVDAMVGTRFADKVGKLGFLTCLGSLIDTTGLSERATMIKNEGCVNVKGQHQLHYLNLGSKNLGNTEKVEMELAAWLDDNAVNQEKWLQLFAGGTEVGSFMHKWKNWAHKGAWKNHMYTEEWKKRYGERTEKPGTHVDTNPFHYNGFQKILEEFYPEPDP